MKLSSLWRKKEPFHGLIPWPGTWEEAEKATSTYQADGVVSAIVAKNKEFLSQLEQEKTNLDGWTLQLIMAFGVILFREKRQTLKVLDFGGGSGRYFHLLRKAFPDLQLDWTILETSTMAQANQIFCEPGLRWISEMPRPGEMPSSYDICLASGSLQYLPKVYNTIQELFALGRYVVINRTPVMDWEEDALTIHKVDPKIYTGSFPVWIFSRTKFKAFLATLGTLQYEWLVPEDLLRMEGKGIRHRGYLCKSNAHSSVSPTAAPE